MRLLKFAQLLIQYVVFVNDTFPHYHWQIKSRESYFIVDTHTSFISETVLNEIPKCLRRFMSLGVCDGNILLYFPKSAIK